jgi:hypothetical protein
VETKNKSKEKDLKIGESLVKKKRVGGREREGRKREVSEEGIGLHGNIKTKPIDLYNYYE